MTEDNVEQMMQELKDRFPTEGRVFEFPGGVQVGLRPTLVGDAIYLMKIKTAYADRGCGSASDALREICDIADQHGVILVLEVEPWDSSGLRSLATSRCPNADRQGGRHR